MDGGMGSNINLKGNSYPEICLSSVALMKRVKPFVALKQFLTFQQKDLNLILYLDLGCD